MFKYCVFSLFVMTSILTNGVCYAGIDMDPTRDVSNENGGYREQVLGDKINPEESNDSGDTHADTDQ